MGRTAHRASLSAEAHAASPSCEDLTSRLWCHPGVQYKESLMPMIAFLGRRAARALACTIAFAGLCGPLRAELNAPHQTLAPHRAIYDLKLAQSRGKRALQAVRG